MEPLSWTAPDEPPEDREFRAELRAWLEANVADELREASAPGSAEDLRRRAAREWQRRLHEGGWIAVAWPREWGGREATPTQTAIFHEETALARAPNPINAIGIWNIGPMLLASGTEEQKRRWLPAMLSGERIWCQGFSEPGAGSDLAALRTRAEVTPDGFVVNGQKVWTTYADIADECLALARTDPSAPKHRGISALVIDMHASGVEVHPIREITGDAGFNEIFLTDVHVPRESLVGELNRGWETAIATLTHERMGTTALGIQLRRQLDEVIDLARRVERAGKPAIENPLLRDRLIALHIDVETTRLLAVEALAKLRRGESPSTEVALGKLQWSLLSQRIADLAVELLGPLAPLARGSPDAVDGGRWQHVLLWSRMTTIGAGTTEIQKNVIAQRGLGLPRGS